MKKILCSLLIAMVACAAFGQMDDRTFSASTVTTNVGTKAYTLRGTLESVYVTIPAGKTCDVAVASTEGTLFSKSAVTSATDGWFTPRLATHTSGGVAYTIADTAGTNSVLEKAAMAGLVTATFTPAANTTETNAYSIKLIYSK